MTSGAYACTASSSESPAPIDTGSDLGLRRAAFFTRAHNRLLRTGLAELNDPAASTTLQRAFARVEAEMDRLAARAHLAV